MAAKLTIKTNGQTLVTALYKQDGTTAVSVFSDQNLSSSTTVGTITSDTTYWVATDDHYVLSVTQPDGSQIANSNGATAKLYLAAGSPVEVSPMPTAAQLAADMAVLPDRTWISAAAFAKGLSGSAVLTSGALGSRWPGWSLDDSTTENIAASAWIPWPSATVYLYWGTSTGNSGNVVFTLNYNLVTGDGDDLATGDQSLNPNAQAGVGAGILKITTVGTIPAGGLYHLRLDRNGTSGSDTLVGDVQVLGLMLVKA